MKVALPIEVPESRYCHMFDYEVKNWCKKICKHFDLTNDVTCNFNLGEQKRTKEGFLKPPNCIELKVIK